MISQEQFLQLKAFSRLDGFFMGLFWIAAFACFVNIFSYPVLSIVFELLILLVPVVLWIMSRRYRDKVIDGVISFRRAFAYCWFVCFYATLILSVSQLIYFMYLDNGAFVYGFSKMMQAKESMEVLKSSGMDVEFVNEAIAQLQNLKPIDLVFSFFSQIMTWSLLVSFLVALFVKRKVKKLKA